MKKILIYSAVAALFIGGTSSALANDNEHKEKGHHKGGMFKKMDADSDGVVTKEEFMAKSEKRFSKMDLDNDGKITKEEKKSAHKAMKEKRKEKKEKEID